MTRLLSFSASAPAEGVFACCAAGVVLAGLVWHMRVALTAAKEHSRENKYAGRNNFVGKLNTF